MLKGGSSAPDVMTQETGTPEQSPPVDQDQEVRDQDQEVRDQDQD